MLTSLPGVTSEQDFEVLVEMGQVRRKGMERGAVFATLGTSPCAQEREGGLRVPEGLAPLHTHTDTQGISRCVKHRFQGLVSQEKAG